MRKKRNTNSRRVRRKTKDFMSIGIGLIVLVVLLQQMNVHGLFYVQSVSASYDIGISMEQDKFIIGDLIKVRVATVTEEEEIVSVELPEGVSYNEPFTMSANDSQFLIEYESTKNEINLIFDEEHLGNNHVDLFFHAVIDGEFSFAASSSIGKQSNKQKLVIDVEELPIEEESSEEGKPEEEAGDEESSEEGKAEEEAGDEESSEEGKAEEEAGDEESSEEGKSEEEAGDEESSEEGKSEEEAGDEESSEEGKSEEEAGDEESSEEGKSEEEGGDGESSEEGKSEEEAGDEESSEKEKAEEEVGDEESLEETQTDETLAEGIAEEKESEEEDIVCDLEEVSVIKLSDNSPFSGISAIYEKERMNQELIQMPIMNRMLSASSNEMPIPEEEEEYDFEKEITDFEENTTGLTAEVRTPEEYRNAIQDRNVSVINIMADFNYNTDYSVSAANMRDISINGNGHVFTGSSRITFNGNEHTVYVYNWNMETSNIYGPFYFPNYNNIDENTLKFHNMRVDGQQMSWIQRGNFIVSGKTSAQLASTQEIIQANNVTFKNGTDFIANTTYRAFEYSSGGPIKPQFNVEAGVYLEVNVDRTDSQGGIIYPASQNVKVWIGELSTVKFKSTHGLLTTAGYAALESFALDSGATLEIESTNGDNGRHVIHARDFITIGEYGRLDLKGSGQNAVIRVDNNGQLNFHEAARVTMTNAGKPLISSNFGNNVTLNILDQNIQVWDVGADFDGPPTKEWKSVTGTGVLNSSGKLSSANFGNDSFNTEFDFSKYGKVVMTTNKTPDLGFYELTDQMSYIAGTGTPRADYKVTTESGEVFTGRMAPNGVFVIQLEQPLPTGSQVFVEAEFNGSNKSYAETTVLDRTNPTADPVPQVIDVNDSFPLAAKDLVTNLNDNYSTVDELTVSFISVPDVSNAGFYTAIVEVADAAGNRLEVNIPIFAKDEFTVVEDQYAIRALHIDKTIQELEGLLENQTIESFLLNESKAQAWDVVNGTNLTQELLVKNTNLEARGGKFTAAFQLENQPVENQISISIDDTALFIDTAVLNESGDEIETAGEKEKIIYQYIPSFSSALHSKISNVEISTVLPEGINLDEESIQLNGTSLNDYSYNQELRLLTMHLDELLADREYKFQFSGLIEEKTEGSILRNGVTVSGKVGDRDLPEVYREINLPIVAGELKFENVPNQLSFGVENKLPYRSARFYREDPDWAITVKDTRSAKEEWQVLARVNREFTGEDDSLLPGALIFAAGEDESSETILNHSFYPVHTDKIVDQSYATIKWDKNRGLLLRIPSGLAKSQNYHGEIEWLLIDAP
ncbi:MAG: pectate lyase-like adhesive domain-containing protein [Bacillota bacterium]